MVYLCALNINIISRDISQKDINISSTDTYVLKRGDNYGVVHKVLRDLRQKNRKRK